MDRELAVFLWTVCHDRDFLRQYRSELDVAVLPRGPSRYLLTLALKAWEDDKAMLTPVAIEMLVETTDPKSFSTTLDEVLEVYAEAYDRYDYDEQDIGLLESIAIKWFRKQRLGLRLDEASEALEQADLEGADRALRESTRVIQPPAEGLNILDFGNAKSRAWRPAIPTGFKWLDQQWQGGLHLQQLGIILAPYNTGKSMLAPFFAGQALRANKGVLYYSTELSEETVLSRIVSSIVKMPIRSMDIARAEKKLWSILDQYAMMSGSEEEDTEHPFLEVLYRDALSFSPRDIESDLETRLDRGHRIGLIICDGDDLKSERKFEKPYDMYLNIYTDLAALSQRRDVAIWTTAQGNRQSEKVRLVSGQHIADSIAKMRKADLVLGLQHRPDWRMDDFGPQRPYMLITIAKDRFYGTRGKTLRVGMRFGSEADGYAGFDDTDGPMKDAEDDDDAD